MGAHFQPGADAGFAGVLERFLELLDVNVQLLHFLVILFATLITQGGVELFLGIDGGPIAENPFWHNFQLLLQLHAVLPDSNHECHNGIH